MSEWKNYQLGDILDKIIGGGTPSKSNPEYWNGSIPWASVKDIQDKIYKISLTVDSITEAGLKNSASNLIPKNTVILATRMSLGRCFIADFDVAINQDLKALIPKKDLLDNNYLLWLIASLSKAIDFLGIGTTVKGITLESLKKIKVQLPQLEEQKRIAAVLSCLDAKIDNLRRQNETLEKIAQTLFKHWFIDFEFPNEEGKPYKSSGGAMSPSELGDIPAGWKVGKLGDVVNINAANLNQDYKYKNIEYIDISSVGLGTLESTNPYSLEEAPSRARRLVSHGDVIWSGVRPNRKSYLFISHPPENLVVSTGFITLTPKLIPSSYLYSWVTTESFVDYLGVAE